ncbi:MAG: IS1595 family transposase [Bacillota bacterium]
MPTNIDINNLTDEQKEQLIIALQASLSKSQHREGKLINEIRETKFKKGFACPICGSISVVRHGTYNGRQRYLCKDCHKTFSDLTNTPLSRTKFPDKWIPFVECMLKGYSLRKSAEIIGVSYVSLFYWRHKLLTALTEMENNAFDGIVEMDETYFLHSEKGKKNLKNRKARKRGGASKLRGISHEQVCVLVARDRSKNTVSKVSCMGRIRTEKVDELVGSFLSPSNILCTDGWRAYKTYAKDKGMEYYALKDRHVLKGIYHIQNVNSYHSRMKKWLDRFNGVASKYLDNYLAWFKFLDSKGFEDNTTNLKSMLVESCLHSMCVTNDSLRLREFMVA